MMLYELNANVLNKIKNNVVNAIIKFNWLSGIKPVHGSSQRKLYITKNNVINEIRSF